jgi:Fe-S-cluster containining protein
LPATHKVKYQCQKCGTCCRQPWEIILHKQDILKWEAAGKQEFLQHIQINPISISPAGLGDPRFGRSVIELPQMTQIKDFDEKQFEAQLKLIKEFVLENHNYLGEGPFHFPVHGYFAFFFPTNTYFEGKGERPLFSPKNFKAILDGIELGLQYILIFNPAGHCNFLEGNLCSIHDLKPIACRMFPYDTNGNLRVEEKILKLCRGFDYQSPT